MQRLAVVGGLAGALAADHDIDAVIAEDALQQPDVGEPGHVVEDQRLLGEKARDHQRQRGVFRAGNRNGAVKRPAADNANPIHQSTPRGPFRNALYAPGARWAQSETPAVANPACYSEPGLRRKSEPCAVSPSSSRGGFIGKVFGQAAIARAGLLFPPFEVFPQGRRQPLAARRRFRRFAGRSFAASAANSLRQMPLYGKDRPVFIAGIVGFNFVRGRCRSSVVEHSLGKGEVLSSILSGSTTT